MAERRYELSYELVRQDWISFNETYLRESPEWIAEEVKFRRRLQRQVLWISPIFIGVATLFIGRAEATQGWYVEGAAIGTAFMAALYFVLPRISDFEKAKSKLLENVRRMDVSGFVGKIAVAVDEHGVEIRTPSRELKLSWQAVMPVESREYTLLLHGGQDGTIVPHRTFGSPEEAKAFFQQATAWCENGRGPHAVRLERYLSDRDCACPKCQYNLRGVRGESCPECGGALLLETLISSPSSTPAGIQQAGKGNGQ